MGELMEANLERARAGMALTRAAYGHTDLVEADMGPIAPPRAVSIQGVGMKFDGGKPRWSLMMEGLPKFLEGVAKVLTFGAGKYAAHSWRGVPEGYERYRDALYRHLNAIERGETHDPESGLPHWYHVGCNVGFCTELDERIKE